MIEKIKLINFRGYEDAEFEFQPLSVIVGCNRHGKSTLLEAIALLGAAADIAARLAPPDGSDRMTVVGGQLADIAANIGGWEPQFRRKAPDHLAIEATFAGYGPFLSVRLTATRVPGRGVEARAEAVFNPAFVATDGSSAGSHPSVTLVHHLSSVALREVLVSEAELDPAGGWLRNRLARLGEATFRRLNRSLRVHQKVEITARTPLADVQVGAPLIVQFTCDGESSRSFTPTTRCAARCRCCARS
jgi:hypothetical protein